MNLIMCCAVYKGDTVTERGLRTMSFEIPGAGKKPLSIPLKLSLISINASLSVIFPTPSSSIFRIVYRASGLMPFLQRVISCNSRSVISRWFPCSGVCLLTRNKACPPIEKARRSPSRTCFCTSRAF